MGCPLFVASLTIGLPLFLCACLFAWSLIKHCGLLHSFLGVNDFNLCHLYGVSTHQTWAFTRHDRADCIFTFLGLIPHHSWAGNSIQQAHAVPHHLWLQKTSQIGLISLQKQGIPFLHRLGAVFFHFWGQKQVWNPNFEMVQIHLLISFTWGLISHHFYGWKLCRNPNFGICRSNLLIRG